jgi:2-oxoglutarate dehydrogenase E1 component
LEVIYYNLSENDLRGLPANLIGGPVAETSANAWQAIALLRQIYAHTIGYDYDHLRNHEERQWLRQMAESRHFRPPHAPYNARALLEQLTKL